MNAQEHYKTEKEIQDELTEQYGDVTIAGLTFESGRILREFDVPFFDGCIAESLQWECDCCGNLFDEDDKESAEECCKETFECPVCGEEYDKPEEAEMCCEDDEEEDTDDE